MNKDARIVFSTDPKMNEKCPKCKELLVSCSCKEEESAQGFSGPVTLRIEKGGRGEKL